jgi:hypothetical protein
MEMQTARLPENKKAPSNIDEALIIYERTLYKAF